MEPEDLLCSRNARPQKDEKGGLVILLLAERARYECVRLGQERVSARSGSGG
jgi:hypothetical protein